ncbi:MAG: hypothetical protein ACKVU0_08840 [Saprospiraceae bacterium]
MDKTSQLQRQKAALEAQIEQQRADLKETFREIREEIEPSNLLKKAVSGALGLSPRKPGEPQPSILRHLPAPVSFLVDILVRDPKWALGLKLLAPVVLKFWRRPEKQHGHELGGKSVGGTIKTKVYGKLRSGISKLRTKLRKPEAEIEKIPEIITEQPEN